ncbi:hypothetical protein EBZ39_16800 [bacterium]|nr:hypothetical protein [bacterium]
MSGYWIAVFLSTFATAILLIRLAFLYVEYLRVNATLKPYEPEAVREQAEEPRNEVKRPVRKTKAAKKKPAKKSKKKKKN